MKTAAPAVQPSTPPRSRAERADKARNRARILAAASEAFAETGVETQVDEVAARAGLAVGTLYRHFATKEALMVAIVERTFADVLELTRRGIDRADDEPFEVLADVVGQLTEAVADDAAARAALLSDDAIAWAGVRDVVADIKAALEVLVDRAEAALTLRGDVTAADIWTASCGVCAMMQTGSSDWRRHLEIVLDGLRRRDDRAAGWSTGPDIARALARDRAVDITTTGRNSGQPRRIEIWMYELGGSLYISGWPGRPRGWYANLLSTPEFTLHLETSIQADLPARARPITDPAERRAVGGQLADGDALAAGSPLVEVELLPWRGGY